MSRPRFWLATIALVLILFFFPACGAATKQGPQVGPGRDSWVRVENPTWERLVIYEQGSDTRIGSVEALGSACLKLQRRDGQTQLYARVFASGGQVIAAPPMDATRSWRWRINTSAIDYAPDLTEMEPCGR